MYILTIKASDAFGHAKLLEIEAVSAEQALLQLKEEGFSATSSDIQAVREKSFFTRFKAIDWEGVFLRIPKKEIHRLIKLIGNALVRGKTLKDTLEFIGENEDHRGLKKLVHKLRNRMDQPFTTQVEIFSDHPTYFDEEFLGIIEAGETSSNLGDYLVDYAAEKKKQEEMNQKFFNILLKRLTTFVMVLGVTGVVIAFVIPQFQSLFGEKLKMPWAMELLMNLSDFLVAHAVSFFLVATLLISFFVYLIKNNPLVRWKWDDFLLHFPLLGRTLKTYHTTQFAYLLSTLLTKNVDIVKALAIVVKQTNNVCMVATYKSIATSMQAGDDLFSAIIKQSESGRSYMISSIVQAAKVGAETASLGTTLMDVRHDLSELLTLRLERSIKSFSLIFYALIFLFALFIAYAIGTAIITFYNNAQNLI